jgi:glycosyltransferase involved in cell wall biosynthesis
MMIAVLCPFSKPTMAERLAANIRRQRLAPDVVVCVENGPGLGASPAGLDVVRAPEAKTAADAKNAGLAHLRRTAPADAIVAVMDCDDYYGPGYLSAAAIMAARGSLLGRQSPFVLDHEGLFSTDIRPKSPWFVGGTHVFILADAPDYEPRERGEDVAFGAGFSRLVDLGPSHYCYMLTGGTDHASGADFRAQMGALGFIGEQHGPHLDRSLIDEGSAAA